jgi:hypothetical protein
MAATPFAITNGGIKLKFDEPTAEWYARQELNLRPLAPEASALSN